MQRIEANEGTDMRSQRKEVIRSIAPMEEQVVDDNSFVDNEAPVKRRGRPRKI
jgi:hypothetical protein